MTEPAALVTPRSLAREADDIAAGRYDMDENPQTTVQRLAGIVRDALLIGAWPKPGDGALPSVRDEA